MSGTSRPFWQRWVRGRLELWLLGLAAALVAVPLPVIIPLRYAANAGDSRTIEALAIIFGMAYVLGFAMAGGLVVAAAFVFVRRKLGG